MKKTEFSRQEPAAARLTAVSSVNKTRYLIQAAVIGAVYAVLTLLLAPISYGPMQIRVSEALTVLPFFTPAAVPGLFVGCFVANLISPYGVIDLICGSLASLLAAIGSRLLRRRPLLVPLPPVAANGLIVGWMLWFFSGVEASFWLCILWVAAGQVIACYGVGYPLLRLLRKRSDLFRLD